MSQIALHPPPTIPPIKLPLPPNVARTSKYHSKSFLSRMDESTFWEAYVGATLSRCGFYVIHQPMDLKQDKKQFEACAQSFDLEVSVDGLFGAKVEVKSMRSWEADDSDNVFVCSLSNFTKKWPGAEHTGRHFLMVDKATGMINWLPKGSPISLSERFDRSRNELFKTVVANKFLFRPLEAFVDHLREEQHT